MDTILFQGTPQELKARIDTLILDETPTTVEVIVCSDKSWYLIIWSV
jgi:hypothetical protein